MVGTRIQGTEWFYQPRKEISLGLNENRKETLINDHQALLVHDFDFKSDKVSIDKYQLNAETLEAYLDKILAILFD